MEVSTPRSLSQLQARHPGLILASASQTRLALLRNAGLIVTARAAAIDEAVIKRTARQDGCGPRETALRLADVKAADITVSDALVIGADQLLVCGRHWFDKPCDAEGARAQLTALRGRSHVLYTAIVARQAGRLLWSHVATPSLTMRAFSDDALDAYLLLEGARILSSVGAYRLEGPGIQLFSRVKGEHAAILGLPLLALLEFLRRLGVLRD